MQKKKKSKWKNSDYCFSWKKKKKKVKSLKWGSEQEPVFLCAAQDASSTEGDWALVNQIIIATGLLLL